MVSVKLTHWSHWCHLVSLACARGFADPSACQRDRERSEEEVWRRGGYIGTTAGMDTATYSVIVSHSHNAQKRIKKEGWFDLINE